MFKLWTPKSYSNWARIHKVSERPSTLKIPENIQLVHDITKYGYTEESEISYRSSLSLATTTHYSLTTVTSGDWSSRKHNFLYHVAFAITSGADDDADARLCFTVTVPNTSGTGVTIIPLTEQFIIPKVTSKPSYIGHTLRMPFLCPPYWYPGVLWNGALAASTGALYVVYIPSEE